MFNGEIYNAPTLRTELITVGARFHTDHSDTEVIIAGYEVWGTEVFWRLEGMFALGLWDANRQILLLARDRLGINPLYYSIQGGSLAFASEPKAPLAMSAVAAEVEKTALFDYFAHRTPTGFRTLFRGVEKLHPASTLTFDSRSGLPQIGRYWDLPLPGPEESRHEAEARVEATLAAAARSHLLSDVPVGIFLSGGVDSSLLASLVTENSPITAFTVSSPGMLHERPYAEHVADTLGLPGISHAPLKVDGSRWACSTRPRGRCPARRGRSSPEGH